MRFVAVAVLLIASVAEIRADDAKPTPKQLEFFEKRVRPVLVDNCLKCHGPKKQEGGLRLDSRAAVLKGGETGPAVVAGDPSKGELVEAIGYDPFSFQMPPSGKLPAEQIADLKKWIGMGAPWPGDTGQPAPTEAAGIDLVERAKHWSFQPIRRPELPSVEKSDWARTAVDRFILSKLEAAELSPAKAADKRTLLRRVTFDLTGLPPTPEEIAAFLADDSPNAYEKVVERLLASPRYGERWGRHWLDLVRFAETGGHEFDFPIHNAWPYRDYVTRALNDDVPYDRFVVEHVAGDLLTRPRRNPADGSNESVVGTAFWFFSQGKHSPVDIRAEECDRIDNQLDVFGKTFLGLTIACARCHDHKFDPITAKDYYALAGYMQSSRQHEAIVNPPGETSEPAMAIRRTKREHANAFAAVTADRLRTAVASLGIAADGEFGRKLAGAIEAAKKNVNDPFHPLAVIAAAPNATERENLRRRLLERWLRDASADTNVPEGTEFFEDFENLSGWFVTGHAFGERTTAVGDTRVAADAVKPVRELVAPGMAHSGLVSPRLEGELRSRTFTIEKPIIWYRVARFGGKPNAGRPNKNGQIHLIVDGFQFVRNPLYGQLTLNVPNDGQFRWLRQDARKFVGKNAYIELFDADDGYLVVDRIVFGDRTPPESTNGLVAELLRDESHADPVALAAAYRRAVTKSLDLWRTGRLADDDFATERAELVNWFLKHDLLDPNAKTSEDIARAARSLASSQSAIKPARRALAAADGTGENEFVLIRGRHTKPGDRVPRRFLEVFVEDPEAEPERGSGRLELATRLVGPDNPLTARVIVNRLWQHHFGRGLVPSPDNFGVLGQPASHPELLDWLAAELVRRKWSLKAMHRLMVNSATYRQSSDLADPTVEQRDPANVLLHRANVRRLEGESIRDAILAVSGRLDQRMYGPGILPHLTPFMEGRGRPRSGPLDGSGRRSVYIEVRRNFLSPLFLAFDFPTPFTTTGRRSVSNVPAQALTMMNNPFVVQQAAVWSRRLAERAAEPNDRIAHAYELAFGRRPTDTEIDTARAFLDAQGREYGNPNDPRAWNDLCHALWNVKEFVFVR